MELILSIVLNVVLISFILKDKIIKQKYPKWVVQFYKEMNESIKINKEFTFDVAGIDSKEWIAMYKGIRNVHKFPIDFIELDHKDLMTVKPQFYTGSRIKQFSIIMDYSQEKQEKKEHSLKEHSPVPITYKISYSKVIKD